MASIGHVLVGLAVARAHDHHTQRNPLDDDDPPRPLRMRVTGALLFPLLALLPDADVIAFRFGIPYEDTLGHRGLSHALFTAVVFGAILAWPVARGLRARYLPTALAVVAALASHGLLDMLTDGGLGAAILWPLSDERFFFPVQPIPVSPIGRAFLSTRGLYCAAVELVLFSPFLLYAVVGGRLGRRPATVAARPR